MAAVLNLVTLISSTAAVTCTAYATDWRLDTGEQARSFVLTKSSNDLVTIEGSLDNTTWGSLIAWVSGVTSDTGVVYGSWPYIRAVKSGTNGVAVLKGLI